MTYAIFPFFVLFVTIKAIIDCGKYTFSSKYRLKIANAKKYLNEN